MRLTQVPGSAGQESAGASSSRASPGLVHKVATETAIQRAGGDCADALCAKAVPAVPTAVPTASTRRLSTAKRLNTMPRRGLRETRARVPSP